MKPCFVSAIAAVERLCAQAEAHVELQERTAEVIAQVVPFDVGVHATMDPATLIDTSCVPIGVPPDAERERQVMQLEYTSGDPLSYADLVRHPARAAALRAEVADLSTVRRYVEFGQPLGVHDELRAAFVADGHAWGTMTLYRSAAHPPFGPDEVAFFTAISAPMAHGLRQAFLMAATAGHDLEQPPGHCMVTRSGELLSTTAPAESWLDTLGSGDRTPAAIAAVVANLAGRDRAQVTVTGTAGALVVHAAPAKGTDDDVVSVIIEKPRPVQMAPVIMTAHGLTPREREVTEQVLHGLVTKQIARRLHISEYTVQDHLKSVFDKVGVGTRGELTFELFTRHYLPLSSTKATPGPYGYYLGG
jgi:DNA-binding CsgD family transcriptional regulator